MSITVSYPYRTAWVASGTAIEPVAMELVTPPTVEPLSLVDAKECIRRTTTEEDTLIDRLIAAAREQAEMETDLKLITQTWDLFYDQPPTSAYAGLSLPIAPVQSVVVSYVDADGATQVWSSASYELVKPSLPPAQRRAGYVIPGYGLTYPTVRYQPRAIKVRVVAGYGLTAASVPASIRTGMGALIGLLVGPGRQSAVDGTIVTAVPGVERLFGAFRAY